MDKRFEALKRELFMDGIDGIEEFLGYEIDPEEDKDVTDSRLDMAYDDYSDEELERFYAKFGV